MRAFSQTHTRGFTLLELSVVLVVIGLIVGGIVVGDTMIKEAKIRAALAEYDSYVRAIQEFQEKYMALPGDMNTAESIWGSDTSGGGTCPNIDYNNQPKQATCNGNGNGKIGDSMTNGVYNLDYIEWFRAWQQLSNAGLIDGTFTGVAASGTSIGAIPGLNVPVSKYTGGGWTLFFYANGGAGTHTFAPVSGHVFSFGKTDNIIPTILALLTPAEALSIDKKIDDGKPGSGIVRTWRTAVLANCTDNDTSAANATYKTSYSNTACSLLFFPGF